MKKFLLIGLIVFTLACSDKKDAVPHTASESALVTTKQKAAVRTSGSELKVQLVDVTDSRCPVNAMCVTAGSARLKFNISDNTKAADVSVNFQGGNLKKDSREFILGNTTYVLTVKEVLPYPVATVKTPLEDFEVSVSIGKL